MQLVCFFFISIACVHDNGHHGTDTDNVTPSPEHSVMVPSPPLHHDIWVIPLLVMSGVNLVTIITYWVTKYCCKQKLSFLSHSLLLGLLCSSGLGFSFTLEQSDAVCLFIRVGTGMSYAIIYSSLMVKQVVLISLNTNVYLPNLYQVLLYILSVSVQLVITVQWVVLVPPCQFTSQDLIMSLIYIFLLVSFVTILSIKSLHAKANIQESPTICLLMVMTFSAWVIWPVTTSLIPKTYHSAVFGETGVFTKKLK